MHYSICRKSDGANFGGTKRAPIASTPRTRSPELVSRSCARHSLFTHGGASLKGYNAYDQHSQSSKFNDTSLKTLPFRSTSHISRVQVRPQLRLSQHCCWFQMLEWSRCWTHGNEESRWWFLTCINEFTDYQKKTMCLINVVFAGLG